MKEYVISVILVGVIGSLVSILSPEGELQKQVRLAVGLVLVVVCISPIMNLVDRLSELDLDSVLPEVGFGEEEYESIFYEGYLLSEIENSRDGISAILLDRFGIGEDEAQIKLDVRSDGAERRIECIYITLYGSAIWKDTGAIEDCLRELFGCRVITAIG